MNTPRRIGIIAALRAEARSAGARGGGFQTLERGRHTVVCLAGAGPDNAAAACRALLDDGAEMLMSWGMAGGLDPALAPGTLLTPTRILDADGNSVAVDASAHAWLKAALTAGPTTLLTLDQPAATAAEKASLRSRTAADAVDMESFTIARLAGERGVAFACVRAVIDTAALELPRSALAGIDERGRERPLRSAIMLARRPAELPAILALVRARRRALRALAQAARSLALT